MIFDLIQDFSDALAAMPENFPKRSTILAIARALRLSRHILENDPFQTRSQLVGRLLGDTTPASSELLIRANCCTIRPWLRPYSQILTPPATPLISVINVTPGYHFPLAIIPDETRFLCAAHRDSSRHNDRGFRDFTALHFKGSDSSKILDALIEVRDLQNGHVLTELVGHSDSVLAVAVTPDGKCAVTASADHTLKVWDLQSGDELHTLRGHTSDVYSVAVTSDGCSVVSLSWDGTLNSWDLKSGHLLFGLSVGTKFGGVFAVTSDCLCVVGCSKSNWLKVWDLKNRRESLSYHGHSAGVTAVAVTSDGQLCVSGSEDGIVKVWNLRDGSEKFTLRGHSHTVTSVAVTPDGRQAVSASGDGTLRIWNLESGKAAGITERPAKAMQRVLIMPQHRRIMALQYGGTVRVYDIDELTASFQSAHLGRHSEACVRRIAQSDSLALVEHDRYAVIWDIDSVSRLRAITGSSFLVTADGRFVIWRTDGGQIRIDRFRDAADERTLVHDGGYHKPITTFPDGGRFITASPNGMLVVWSVDDGRRVFELSGHRSEVTKVAVTADGGRAVSASRDNTMRIWDLATGRCLHSLQGHRDIVTSLAITADSQLILSGSWDATVKVWSINNGEELFTLDCRRPGSGAGVNNVAVTADGRFAVSASVHFTLIVWDLKRRERVHLLLAGRDFVDDMALTEDGRHVVSVSGCELRLWDIESGHSVARFTIDDVLFHLKACGITPNGRTILVGGVSGEIGFLHFEEVNALS
jgi:WD40 repeat protein